MRKRASAPEKRRKEKAELDKQTPYATFLPEMGEGFRPGYRERAGIGHDQSARPHEWLESVARYMLTEGEDVGFSIPDVLAGEQQLRRLMRMPAAEALRSQQMIDWRAVLAVLLLWDGWKQDESWPVLTAENASGGDASLTFRASVSKALPRQRAAQGLTIFTLQKRVEQVEQKRPLALLSSQTALVPAADPGDLGPLLPGCVTWYDRKRRRFEDPCEYLDENDRTRLIASLELLSRMNADSTLGSALYAPGAPLVSVLERFVTDLTGYRDGWRTRLESGEKQKSQTPGDWDDTDPREALRLRALAVCGLYAENCASVSRVEQPLLMGELLRNSLIRALSAAEWLSADVAAGETMAQYRLDGLPFAKESAAYWLEPVHHPQERQALARVAQELALPARHSAEWNHRTGERLAQAAAELRRRVGASRLVAGLLEEWSRECLAVPQRAVREVRLQYPMEGRPETLRTLLSELLGLSELPTALGAFADCLLLIERRPQDPEPFEDEQLCRVCRVSGGVGADKVLYAVPPVSPALALWLSSQRPDAADAAVFCTDAQRYVRRELPDGRFAIDAEFAIRRVLPGDEANQQAIVRFAASYVSGEQPERGAAVSVPLSQAPYVVVWPNVRLSLGQWRRYFVLAHQPEQVEAWVCEGGTWKQGERRRATTFAPDGQTGYTKSWQTAATTDFPAWVALKKGALSYGCLCNDVPLRPLRHEPPAVISVDFGSIATTVMLRQGERVLPASFSRKLHRELLRGSAEHEALLADELLPPHALLECEGKRANSFYSVTDVFSDEVTLWRHALLDGHIYYPANLAALMEKSENTLYYDLKWSEEPYVRRCLRLYLEQVMLQALLAARMNGAPSATWRVSVPNAMSAERQKRYFLMLGELARETALLSGVPLTPDTPAVLYTTENHADGLYFRGRNEVNAQNGYINLDLGGGTSDISVWLGNEKQASLEYSLMLGCRQILYESLGQRHFLAFEQDFAQSDKPTRDIVRRIATLFADGLTPRKSQKNMFLLDDFFAGYSRQIAEMIRSRHTASSVSYLEAVLLLNLAFLFHLCGELLRRLYASGDEQTRRRLEKCTRMELCIAGNGGQLLKLLDEDTRGQLCELALTAVRDVQPVKQLFVVQSQQPKQEVAMGLLAGDANLRAVDELLMDRTEAPRSPAPQEDEMAHVQVLLRFLLDFYCTFPQAGRQLLGHVLLECEGGEVRLTPAAAMELQTIADNERLLRPQGDLAMYAACFEAMKRIWKL